LDIHIAPDTYAAGLPKVLLWAPWMTLSAKTLLRQFGESKRALGDIGEIKLLNIARKGY